MTKLLKPGPLFIVVVIMSFSIIYLKGALNIEYFPDSVRYVEFFSDSRTLGGASFLEGVLNNITAFGFPVFLSFVKVISPDLQLLPYFHFSVYVVAVLVLWKALLAWGFSKWSSFVVASAMMFEKIMLQFNERVLTESLSASVLVLTIAGLLFVTSNPRKVINWIFLSLMVFSACMIRSANLFLIGTIPVITFLLVAIRGGSPVGLPALRRSMTLAVGVFAAILVPMIGLSALRLVYTGHFGVTSFGGHNIIGLAAQLLNEDNVEKLSGENKLLAEDILKRAEEMGLPDGFETIGWKDYKRYRTNYTYFIWDTSVPAARKMSSETGNSDNEYSTTDVDKRLQSLSKEIILNEPGKYVKMLSISLGQGLLQNFRLHYYNEETGSSFETANLITIFFVSGALLAFMVHFLVSMRDNPSHSFRTVFDKETRAIFSIAIVNLMASLLLVCLVEVPLRRYAFSCWLLSQSGFALIAYKSLISIWGTITKERPL